MKVGNMVYYDMFYHMGATPFNRGEYAILCLIVKKYAACERDEMEGWAHCGEDIYDIMFNDTVTTAAESMLIEI